MSPWPTEKHFTAWMCVAPGTKITGGKVLSSRTRTAANRVATLLRTAASSLMRSHTALGAFGRRLAARIGEAKALTALTRKLAVQVYHSLKHGRIYKDPGAATTDLQHRNRVLRSLTKRARTLGYELVRIEPARRSLFLRRRRPLLAPYRGTACARTTAVRYAAEKDRRLLTANGTEHRFIGSSARSWWSAVLANTGVGSARRSHRILLCQISGRWWTSSSCRFP